jgi:hypothetical protein
MRAQQGKLFVRVVYRFFDCSTPGARRRVSDESAVISPYCRPRICTCWLQRTDEVSIGMCARTCAHADTYAQSADAATLCAAAPVVTEWPAITAVSPAKGSVRVVTCSVWA